MVSDHRKLFHFQLLTPSVTRLLLVSVFFFTTVESPRVSNGVKQRHHLMFCPDSFLVWLGM